MAIAAVLRCNAMDFIIRSNQEKLELLRVVLFEVKCVHVSSSMSYKFVEVIYERFNLSSGKKRIFS